MAAAELPAPEEDLHLVERLKQGDEVAFDELYERYFDRVFAFVDRRMSNNADAEETVQEVFVNVFSAVSSYRGEAPFSAWLFGLTRRTIASRFKKRRHPTIPMGDAEPEPAVGILPTTMSAEPNPLEAYEYRERVAQMDDALCNKLSREQRALFEAHHLGDRSISELAKDLRKSEDSVKSNLYRARKVLLAR